MNQRGRTQVEVPRRLRGSSPIARPERMKLRGCVVKCKFVLVSRSQATDRLGQWLAIFGGRV